MLVGVGSVRTAVVTMLCRRWCARLTIVGLVLVLKVRARRDTLQVDGGDDGL